MGVIRAQALVRGKDRFGTTAACSRGDVHLSDRLVLERLVLERLVSLSLLLSVPFK